MNNSLIWSKAHEIGLDFPACMTCVVLASERAMQLFDGIEQSEEFAETTCDILQALSESKEWIRKRE